MIKITNFVNGYSQLPNSAHYLDVIEPATGEVYAQVPDSDSSDLEHAICAAEKALYGWQQISLEQRSAILNAIADGIDANAEMLAQAESKDTGKPISLARAVDIPRASANFRFFAQLCTQFASEAHAVAHKSINYTLRQPLGIVGCISPWNLPLYLLTWKIAPALAAGNCVIAKPSEITPMTAFLLADICIKAGLPQGVLNILHGQGATIGAALCTHAKIKAISFTGGTKTGALIASQLAPTFKKLSLELGGKNPALVFADCDLEKAVSKLVKAAFANQGQICLCPSRIYVHADIYQAFKQSFISAVEKIKIADPALPDSGFGAITSKLHQNKVLSYIYEAIDSGATILTGGKAFQGEGRCQHGYFVEPTVIEGLSNSHVCNQEEIFGPVVTLTPFTNEKEAIALANDSSYGLSATIWTENVGTAHRVAEQLEAGIIWVNTWLNRDLRTPFGGVKHSGVGREGGHEAMRFFTEPKNVCITYGD